MRRRFALSRSCDRPSVRGASDAPALAEPLQLKSALRDCLLQRPGVGGHKGRSNSIIEGGTDAHHFPS